jgi:hypothetical protein
MYTNEKIYSIELGEDLTPASPSREQPAASSIRSRPSRTGRTGPPKQAKVESKAPRSGLHFASLMILTWLLGPFSVHLHSKKISRQGSGRGLLTAGMISGMACLGMFAGRGFILDLIGKGWPLWPWVAIGAGVMMTAFSVWARTAYLACRNHSLPHHRMPAMLRRPWVIGVSGLVAPGLGLLLAGCARRGAVVIWSLMPVAAAALILGNSWSIWTRNQGAGQASISPVLLEMGFIAAGVVLLIGLVGWMAQALEGARQMMGELGIRHRMRGDWYAVALVCALVGVALAWDPSVMARQLDSGAVVLQEKGFRVIPLELWKNAHRLDPAPSEYAVRAIEMYEELGRRDDAMLLRDELDENLASYLTMVQEETRDRPQPAYMGRTPAQEWQVMSDLITDHGNQEGRGRYQAR